jgi:uncharacterized protein
MKIDLSNLLKKEAAEQELHIELPDKSFSDGSEDIVILEPVVFNGKLSLLEDLFFLDGECTAKLQLTCYRCLEKFDYEVEIEIHERLTNDSENKDDEIILIDSGTLDITEILLNNIFISLPMKRLCSEDCKGLCQNCGTNLNISTCNCNKEDIDLRLTKLKDIFN